MEWFSGRRMRNLEIKLWSYVTTSEWSDWLDDTTLTRLLLTALPQNTHTKCGGTRSVQNLEYLKIYLLHAAAEHSYKVWGMQSVQILEYLTIYLLHAAAEQSYKVWGTQSAQNLEYLWFYLLWLLRCTIWMFHTPKLWIQENISVSIKPQGSGTSGQWHEWNVARYCLIMTGTVRNMNSQRSPPFSWPIHTTFELQIETFETTRI